MTSLWSVTCQVSSYIWQHEQRLILCGTSFLSDGSPAALMIPAECLGAQGSRSKVSTTLLCVHQTAANHLYHLAVRFCCTAYRFECSMTYELHEYQHRVFKTNEESGIVYTLSSHIAHFFPSCVLALIKSCNLVIDNFSRDM